MLTSRYVRTLWLGMLLGVTMPIAGCGRTETTPLSEGGENSPAAPGATPVEATIEQQTEQKLESLTKDDVDLYLKVMRTAAERVKNLEPADRASLEGAKKILSESATGRVPTQNDVKTLQQAYLVALFMDQIVAEEMKIDGRTYRGIAEAVESALQNSEPVVTTGKPSQPGPVHSPTPLEKRLSGVNATNEIFLAAYRSEIQRLLAIVRNPANLPK